MSDYRLPKPIHEATVIGFVVGGATAPLAGAIALLEGHTIANAALVTVGFVPLFSLIGLWFGLIAHVGDRMLH